MIELRRAFGHLTARLRGRTDSEHEQAAIRVGVGALTCAYLLTLDLSGEWPGASRAILVPVVFFMSASVLLFAAILVRPAPSPWRRFFGILVDMFATSTAMGIAGESGAPLLAIYLWVIIGNGFRFGNRYLGIATAAALIGFGSVALWSEFWGSHPIFSASFLLVLIAIPAYAAVLLKKLNDAIREANAANAAKSQFLAKMSHELRTPLNGVIGMSDLLMDSPLEPQQNSFARSIQDSAQILLGIIENILDISKIEAGRIGVEAIDFDLHRLLSDTIRMFRPQAQRKSLRLTLHIDPDVPFLLHGDPLHTRQILTNLVGNAVKFTEQGRVEVRAALTGPRWTPGTTRLRFEIEDTGIGIPATEHERIFESFRQADSSTTRLYGGTGLGAAIARELTILLGGQIGLTSTLGQGSLFWVELPFAVQGGGAEAGPRTLTETRVLIVGHLDTARDLGRLLATWGLSYQAVSSGMQAFGELLRGCTEREPYDLVLAVAADLDLDPVQLAGLVRAERRLSGTELVLVNAPDNPAAKSVWLRAGFGTVLFAPLDRTLLFNAVHLAQSTRDHADNVVSLADRYRQLADRRSGGLHVLVAEDNETNRTVLRGILERVGHRVTTVNDGEAALDLLESTGDEIDLMILDMNMPNRTGLDVFRAYRFMTPDRQIPTIILTADATSEALAACREAGVDAYLTKPVETMKLLATLARFGKVPPALAPGGVPSGSRTHPATVAVPLIDLAKLRSLQVLGLGTGFLEDLIAGFVRDSLRSIAAIAAANEEQNYAVLHDALHGLRGSAGELGASRIADVCQQLRALKPFELGLARSVQLIERLRSVHEETRLRLDELAREGRVAEP